MGGPARPVPTSATLLAAATMTIMAGATIAPSLPGMVAHFGPESVLGVQLLLTITALAIALAAPVAGWLGDRLGRKPVLWGSVALYVLSGGAGLVLGDLLALQVSRAVLGLAVAGVMTSVAGLIGDLYEGPARDRMLGLQGAAMGFGGVVFLGLGGLLADLGWRGPFAIYLLPLALIALIPVAVPDRRPGRAEALAATDTRPVPPEVLAALFAAACLGMVGFYAVPVQLPFLLAERGMASPVASGLAMAGLTLVSALVGLVYARLSEGAPLTLLAYGAFGSLAVGLGLVAAGPAATWPGLVSTGLGMGLLMPTLSRWLLSIAPFARRGRVMGGLTTAIFAGQFASPLVLAPVIAAAGLSAGFAAAAALSALALICIAVAARPRGTPKTTPKPS